jgi:hypothetical protein
VPGPCGSGRSPGLARRGSRAWQVGKESTRAAPGTGFPLVMTGAGHADRGGGGWRLCSSVPAVHWLSDAPCARRPTGCDDPAVRVRRVAGWRGGRKGTVIARPPVAAGLRVWRRPGTGRAGDAGAPSQTRCPGFARDQGNGEPWRVIWGSRRGCVMVCAGRRCRAGRVRWCRAGIRRRRSGRRGAGRRCGRGR